MSQYGFRDNKFSAKEFSSKKFEGKEVSLALPSGESAANSVTYLKMQSVALGTATPTVGYLYIGSGGALQLSSTVPVGTSGVYANVGSTISHIN